MSTVSDAAKAYLNKARSVPKQKGGNRLPKGKHRLALLRLGLVQNKKTKDQRMEATFEVVQSTALPAGQKASIAFFIQRTNFPEYEFNRMQDFADACDACLGEKIGEALVTEKGRGIILDLTITEELDDEGQVKRSGRGNVCTSEIWAAIPQTWEMVAEARAELTKTHGPFDGAVLQEQETQQQISAPAPNPGTQQGGGYAGPGSQWGQQQQAPAGGSLLKRG